MEIYAEILSQTANLTEAPEYIMVLPLGYISSENGDFLVDRESFRMMKEHMERRAVDIVVDYEHQTLADIQAPQGMDKRACFEKATVSLQRWNGRKGQRIIYGTGNRYLSPVVMVRKKTIGLRKFILLH